MPMTLKLGSGSDMKTTFPVQDMSKYGNIVLKIDSLCVLAFSQNNGDKMFVSGARVLLSFCTHLPNE